MPPKAATASSAKPTQPPNGADMNALVTRVDALSKKAGLGPFVSKLPLWKRWVGGEESYDGTGLRDVVASNALFTDQIKGDVDSLGQAVLELKADVKALQEVPPARPFP